MSKTKTTKEAILELEGKLAPELYIDESFEYVTAREKVKVYCRKHGEKYITFNKLKIGRGCNECKGEKISEKLRLTTDLVVDNFRKKWGNVYDYSDIDYRNNHTSISVICSKHGPLLVTPNKHLEGSGCPKCRTNSLLKSTEEFVLEAEQVHNNRYQYSETYLGARTKISVICKDHGEFLVTPDNHLSKKSGCPLCVNKVSLGELELRKFIEELGEEGEYNVPILDGKHIDIYLPKFSLGIEYCGIYYHSEKFRNKNYHLDKKLIAQKKGISLLQIFEDEWLDKKELVKERIKSKLGVSERTFARRLNIVNVAWSDAEDFLNKTHTQGPSNATKINIGLKDNAGRLLALMTFGPLRFETECQKSGQDYELIRYSSIGTVIGGFSKILTTFVKQYTPSRIISYADRRWSDGEVYKQAGFTLIGETPPGYFYVKNGKRYRREVFQKHKLPNLLEKFEPLQGERENCENNGYFRIFDCGHLKFELKCKSPEFLQGFFTSG